MKAWVVKHYRKYWNELNWEWTSLSGATLFSSESEIKEWQRTSQGDSNDIHPARGKPKEVEIKELK